MSPTDVVPQEKTTPAGTKVVNDFSIQVATVNGSGSQTANLVLLRSILLMGIPVSGKNMFPSNIAGLPTAEHGKYYNSDQMEIRARNILQAYKWARRIAKESIQE